MKMNDILSCMIEKNQNRSNLFYRGARLLDVR